MIMFHTLSGRSSSLPLMSLKILLNVFVDSFMIACSSYGVHLTYRVTPRSVTCTCSSHVTVSSSVEIGTLHSASMLPTLW